MSQPKKKKIDEEAPSRIFDLTTPRGRRRVSLLVIVIGLVISTLHSGGVFDDITNSVPHGPGSGISNVPYSIP